MYDSCMCGIGQNLNMFLSLTDFKRMDVPDSLFNAMIIFQRLLISLFGCFMSYLTLGVFGIIALVIARTYFSAWTCICIMLSV